MLNCEPSLVTLAVPLDTTPWVGNPKAVGVTQAPAANKTPDNDQPKSGILIFRCFGGVFRPSLITNKP
jgi:hypothetical protein